MSDRDIYEARLSRHMDELKWLYCELYHNDMAAFRALLDLLRAAYGARSDELKDLDREREARPDWYRGSDLLGMCLYVKPFAETINGVREKLGYIQEAGVNYLHLMPLLDTVDCKSDGGYAVSDYRKVKPELGTMEDLEAFTSECHRRGMICCLDFVMNHTSEEHEWARRARAGEREYQDYYFFYDSWDIPNEFEKTVPQVFPTTAPGNFTWLEDIGKVVMTCFYPYQWDLNYANPAVFNAMVDNLLYLANRGVDVIRVDAVPYIWKQLGTSCRNLPQVHSIMRMVRMICEIVCPGVLLLGEVVMAPKELAPYFGTPEKPECHMLYNATAMCTIWHTVATKDVRLLRHQLSELLSLPDDFTFLNYLRCHDDIGWGLDFPWLAQFGMEEVPHKAFLNAWFTGEFPGSPARGERYNDDPRLGDARMCGTTASLCGIEAAEQALAVLRRHGTASRAESEARVGTDIVTGANPASGAGHCEAVTRKAQTPGDVRTAANPALDAGQGVPLSGAEQAWEDAIRLDLMLHALIFTLSGVPILYAGDEIGQLNDNRYRDDPAKADDSRYIHRGDFPWTEAGLRGDVNTRQGRLFRGLRKLEDIRRREPIFSADAAVRTPDADSSRLLMIERSRGTQTLLAVFNFSDAPCDVALPTQAPIRDLCSGELLPPAPTFILPAHDFRWLVQCQYPHF